MGSNLITKDLLKASDYKGMAARISETMALIGQIRGGK
jgi:hypothetical protein